MRPAMRPAALIRAAVFGGLLALAGCAQNEFGLGIDLGSGQVTPEYAGTSGDVSIRIGG